MDIVTPLIAAATLLGDAAVKETAKQAVASAFTAIKDRLVTRHDAAAEVMMLEKKPETGGPLIGEIETLSDDPALAPLVTALREALEREAPADHAAAIMIGGNVTDSAFETNATGGGKGAGAVGVRGDVSGSTISTTYKKE